jgi:parallel beta-helix repeat protein
MGSVLGATCNGTGNFINSTTISDGCTLNNAGTSVMTYVMSGEAFNLNGSFNGAIRISGDNIFLDCNNSIIYGNSTGFIANDLNGIVSIGKLNITIRNCLVEDYSSAIFLRSSNNSILNNISASNSYYGIRLDKRSSNNNISSNSLIRNGNYGFYIDTSFHNLLFDNNISENNNNGIHLIDSDNNLIKGNTFYGGKLRWLSTSNINNLTFSYNVQVSNGSLLKNVFDNKANELFIEYNTVINPDYFFYSLNLSNFTIIGNNISNASTSSSYDIMLFSRETSNGYIYNNSIDGGDNGLHFSKSAKNITIFKNRLTNQYYHTDKYDSSITLQADRNNPEIYNFTEFNISNNNLIDFGCVGINYRNLHNSYIINNYFSQNYSKLISKSFNCGNEPLMAIFSQEIYKGYIPVGTQLNDSYSLTSRHYSNNISILGNTFNNINVLLRTQGTTNLIQDISNFWFKSWQLSYLMDRDDYYISNDFANLTTINPSGTYTTVLQQGINGNFSTNYSFFRGSYDYFKNINLFDTQYLLFNRTSSLAYNGTSICNGSSSTISQNTGNINITLRPNEPCTILDIYNLTEGTNRENSPFVIRSSNMATDKKVMYVSSNLTNNVNLTSYISTSSCDINRITITPNSSTESTLSYDCNNSQITLYNTTLNKGDDNLIQVYYTVENTITSGGGSGGSSSIINSTNVTNNIISNSSSTNNTSIEDIKESIDSLSPKTMGIIMIIILVFILGIVTSSRSKR